MKRQIIFFSTLIERQKNIALIIYIIVVWKNIAKQRPLTGKNNSEIGPQLRRLSGSDHCSLLQPHLLLQLPPAQLSAPLILNFWQLHHPSSSQSPPGLTFYPLCQEKEHRACLQEHSTQSGKATTSRQLYNPACWVQQWKCEQSIMGTWTGAPMGDRWGGQRRP